MCFSVVICVLSIVNARFAEVRGLDILYFCCVYVVLLVVVNVVMFLSVVFVFA